MAAIAGSPAYKLLIPVPQPDSFWLGVEKEDEAALTKQAAAAIVQIAAGEPVRPVRQLAWAPSCSQSWLGLSCFPC